MKPVLQDDAFLTDVNAARAEADDLHLWWLGQSGFLVQWQGRHCLFDPYLSESLTQKYEDTDKPHVRMTGRVIAPERLDFIDIVTSTHNHTDHLDAETLLPLKQANPELKLVLPLANITFAAERLQCKPDWLVGFECGGRSVVDPFSVTGVPAAHEKLECDDLGRCHHMGFIVQFGPWTVYHSGDTVRYDGMAEQLRPYNIDIALLPINGRNPERRVPGNLTGKEAAQLGQDIGARLVVPCHFDLFEFNSVTPDAFIAEAERIGQPYKRMQNGERWSSRELD
ncbi:MAG: MBL fold metallo-hydrolase [Candidatus Hinthialibacter antarcticus]|nr:MBL fold metallo-hydrolase [Candidatus Hinthialibacter antarcticus]